MKSGGSYPFHLFYAIVVFNIVWFCEDSFLHFFGVRENSQVSEMILLCKTIFMF